ncbi:zinc finger protein 329-like [Phymastichus coffea]|uniref:zinc finger protein 329-like n=1 Tax=Phymastichus coffea TaxID=108790 RepID=UPI00273AA40F|nr:zinc finger protein 329-like [Phymastichus coffea]
MNALIRQTLDSKFFSAALAQCPRCGKHMIENALKKHLAYCEAEASVLCEKCGKLFKNASKLEQHERFKHAARDPIECEKCHTTLKNESSLNVHLLSCNKRKFICGECKKTFQRKDYLTKHVLVVHVKGNRVRGGKQECYKCQQKPFYGCTLCGREFEEYHQIKRHFDSVCDVKGHYHCPDCSYSTPIKQHIKLHLKVHSNNNNGRQDVNALFRKSEQ